MIDHHPTGCNCHDCRMLSPEERYALRLGEQGATGEEIELMNLRDENRRLLELLREAPRLACPTCKHLLHDEFEKRCLATDKEGAYFCDCRKDHDRRRVIEGKS